MISSQEATILSRPSVIVLDGRQARIVVGQQIPVSETAVSENFATTKVKYIQVGIVSNLRPRVSDDNRFVSMQIEAIISEAEERLGSGTTSGVLSAPTINSRKVQTYVNVPDDTPFIIGGLISSKKSNQRGGIPILSDIPILGSLFRFKINKEEKKEKAEKGESPANTCLGVESMSRLTRDEPYVGIGLIRRLWDLKHTIAFTQGNWKGEILTGREQGIFAIIESALEAVSFKWVDKRARVFEYYSERAK